MTGLTGLGAKLLAFLLSLAVTLGGAIPARLGSSEAKPETKTETAETEQASSAEGDSEEKDSEEQDSEERDSEERDSEEQDSEERDSEEQDSEKKDPAERDSEAASEEDSEDEDAKEEDAEEEDAEEEDAGEDAPRVYVINKTRVSRDSSSVRTNCFEYAAELYELIWARPFENGRDKDDNYLKNIVSTPDLELTEENLKAYVTAAEPGSVLRTTDRANLFATEDETGHSQLIVDQDEEGFTVLESNIWLNPGIGPREHYYTWAEYVETWYNANHRYIKYIKNPKAKPLDCLHRLADGSGAWVIRQEDGEWVTDCSICGEAYEMPVTEEGPGLCLTVRWCQICEAPFRQAATGEILAKDSMVMAIGTAENSYGELWYQTRCGWIFSGDLEELETQLGESTRSDREENS